MRYALGSILVCVWSGAGVSVLWEGDVVHGFVKHLKVYAALLPPFFLERLVSWVIGRQAFPFEHCGITRDSSMQRFSACAEG